MASSLQQMAHSMIEHSRTLINNDLKRICKEEGCPQTGNKVHLQARVLNRTLPVARCPPPQSANRALTSDQRSPPEE
jgi:hypothetical protein